MQSRVRLLQISSDPALCSLREISKCPSFTTEGSVKKMVKSVPPKTMLLIFATGHPELPFSNLSQRLDIKEFNEGAKKAIEVVSKGISRRDFSQMTDCLTADCCLKEQRGEFKQPSFSYELLACRHLAQFPPLMLLSEG